MKRTIASGLVLAILMVGFLGCAGGPIRPAEPEPIYLDTWLEEDAFDKIVEHLRTNSYMKDLPFIIVRAKGEAVGQNISQQIDSLTEEVRDRLVSLLLEYPEIKLIRRHPVSVLDRPYKLQELKCDGFVEHKMLLTIDIKRLGRVDDNLARVNIRAIDLKKGNWITGFSLHNKVVLTRQQRRDLAALHRDEYLRGLKYVPFLEPQRDEMAAYLARNLSCIFREAYTGNDMKVFVDSSKLRRKNKNIAWFVKKQLHFCNEILLCNNRENADWVLVAEAKETGSGTGLAQFWIELYERKGGELVKGLATYTYFVIGEDIPGSITGRWKILNLPSRLRYGFMEITMVSEHNFRGDLLGPDGGLLKRGIGIRLRGNNIDWTYYDDRLHKTFQVKGLLLKDGEKMAVRVSSFPSSEPSEQELVLVE